MAKLKIGDRVAVLDDSLKGKVISLSGNNAVIEDEHGFSYEYAVAQLVRQEEEIYAEIHTPKKSEPPKHRSKKHHKKPVALDLHFENLVDNPADYSPSERIWLQQEKLRNTLDYCRKNNLKKLEIIHGIGDGVLQQMVHDVLESYTGIDYHNREILHDQSGTVLVFFT